MGTGSGHSEVIPATLVNLQLNIFQRSDFVAKCSCHREC